MTDRTEGNHSKNSESLDEIAAELAKGNGCAAKLYLDTLPNEDARNKAFTQIKEKYAELNPAESDADKVRFDAYRDTMFQNSGMASFTKEALPTYNREISAYKGITVPGIPFGTNTFGVWSKVYSYTVNTDTQTAHRNMCRNLEE